MKMFLSHFTAAQYWNIPYLNNVFDQKFMDKYPLDQYTYVTFTNRKFNYQKKNRISHVCELVLPRGAVINQGDFFVASPELIFLELANYLDIHRLILLGIQLCSHTLAKKSNAITTKNKLSAFLSKTMGHHGHQKAVRALKFIENGSASIMESIAYMIFTLPYLYGGFGLTGASFNHEILLYPTNQRLLKQKRCFADIYYADSDLAIEYDSHDYHSDSDKQKKDLIRATALKNQGIDLLRLSSRQLYDKRACNKFAQTIAAYIGKRIRTERRIETFNEAHKNLRILLPKNDETTL